MFQLLLVIIYLAFISLGLPDALLGSAWPSMYRELGASVSYAGIISMIIAGGTIISSLFSDRLIKGNGCKCCNDGSSPVWLFLFPFLPAAVCLGCSLWPGSRQRGCGTE